MAASRRHYPDGYIRAIGTNRPQNADGISPRGRNPCPSPMQSAPQHADSISKARELIPRDHLAQSSFHLADSSVVPTSTLATISASYNGTTQTARVAVLMM